MKDEVQAQLDFLERIENLDSVRINYPELTTLSEKKVGAYSGEEVYQRLEARLKELQ